MAPYRNIVEYPVFAWCFHGRGAPGYNVEYVQQAAMSGFNALIDVALMLNPATNVPVMMVMVPAFKFTPERLNQDIFDNFANHPRLVGVILDDNCPGIYPQVRASAQYVAEKFPHVAPYISENPSRETQATTALRILGSQNYEMYRGAGVVGYCGKMGRDSRFGNRNNMSFWPLFAAPMNASCYRFQAYAAVAHGAQGIVCFAYAPGDRWPEWKAPDGWLSQAARPVHLYIRKVAGRHIWGTRCVGVLHSEVDNIPKGQAPAGPGKLVESMDQNLLAGFHVPEAEFEDFKEGPFERAPLYCMVVDTRVSKNADPGRKDRTVQVRFHRCITHVEVFPKEAAEGPVKIRPIEPGACASLFLLSGDGLFLRLNPPLDELLGPLAEPYLAVNRKMTELGARLREAKAAAAQAPTATNAPAPAGDGNRLGAGEFDTLLAGIAADIERLRKRAEGDQAQDTVFRLGKALDYLRTLSAENPLQ
jgi:hypothetical protein